VSDASAILYLEADDEVTSVVRRLRAADPGPVLVVAPGRSRATSSVVALRLLGRAADAEDRSLTIVGDALTRSLAAEAGLPAYATLEEARRADGSAPPPAEPRRAAIHVVRRPATADTAPTLAAAAVAATATVAAGAQEDAIVADADATRPVPVVRPAPRPATRPGPTVARPLPAALLGALGLLLAGAVVAGAAFLPAATITIAPHAETIGPRPYAVVIEDASRHEGTATATAGVTATGTYQVLEPATGAVVFLNWTAFPVEVGAESLVAAGEQAFATTEAVVVPPGDLTSEGTIQAGEASVGVVAAAPGPAANVAAGAIDTVLDRSTAARLRGFPSNPERLVTNPDPTAGGVDTSGPEITQADVDAAVQALRDDLAAAVATAVADVPDGITLVAEPVEPTIEGLDGLVGTRDQETAEIGGSQPWSVDVADPDQVTAAAQSAFLEDPAAVPAGMEVLPGSTTVTLGGATADGEAMRVDTTVTARAAQTVDPDAVRDAVSGATADEAEAALDDIGQASVELWPGWVTTVPTMDWRVEVVLVDAEASAQ
jgi:hypothetical protein